ncbi:triose-phosphate isomerase [Sulfurimonas sp. MAG313]|nr:triose-phosphate isomerase [Sulfurimonas sp. MAG313]MDF1880412.1 triose-phosphate isomerase [Sulfurimonas sp. MAG313]
MIVAANFKTNKTRAQTRDYMDEVNEYIRAENVEAHVIVFPPATAYDNYGQGAIQGAQNAYAVENGAFTGEIGLDQLKEFGIKTILIGHSERRHILGESQEEIAFKFAYFQSLGYEIVYCIGEQLETRKLGEAALMQYIETQLVGIDMEYEKLIIAYEPVWAIGTGLVPSNEDIFSIHKALRAKTSRPLLYGGSVKVNNMREIVDLDNVDGVLVGGASLYAQSFCEMIKIAEEA